MFVKHFYARALLRYYFYCPRIDDQNDEFFLVIIVRKQSCSKRKRSLASTINSTAINKQEMVVLFKEKTVIIKLFQLCSPCRPVVG